MGDMEVRNQLLLTEAKNQSLLVDTAMARNQSPLVVKVRSPWRLQLAPSLMSSQWKLQGTEKAAGSQSMSRYPKASQHQRDPMRGRQRSASLRRSSASAGAPRVAHVPPLVGPAVPLTLSQQLLHQDRLKGQQQAQEQVLQDHAQQVQAQFPQHRARRPLQLDQLEKFPTFLDPQAPLLPHSPANFHTC